ncbi:hypothetical protein WJX82_006495 [Trebouxia sp. C0006]
MYQPQDVGVALAADKVADLNVGLGFTVDAALDVAVGCAEGDGTSSCAAGGKGDDVLMVSASVDSARVCLGLTGSVLVGSEWVHSVLVPTAQMLLA